MTSSKKEYEENFYSILSSYHNNFIGYENWENILFKGNIIKDDINAAIANSSYCARDNKESWVRLWHFDDLEEEEFKTILADVLAKFKNNEYLEHETILHVTAILLSRSKQGLCNTPQTDILKQAKANIDVSTTTFKDWQQNEAGYRTHDTPYFLAYSDRESDEFKKIIEYLTEKSRRNFNIELKDKGNILLDDFRNNDIDALENLALLELKNPAIFSQIDVDDFIGVLLAIKHANLQNIVAILKQRYQYHPKLTQELEFWQGVDKNLLDKIDKDKQRIKYFLMNKFKGGALKIIITILKSRVSE